MRLWPYEWPHRRWRPSERSEADAIEAAARADDAEDQAAARDRLTDLAFRCRALHQPDGPTQC